ncbi:MAG: hypothetical protein Q4Q24_00345 [Methanobrevibacter ruminantium]|uniref:hypothetical protein n=1 Tax=Methanobrevibacter ruminantium TaxID=83816 RepID=UPI0026EF7284|nr:hypothetical protein [Methanobrevibacter ruminantium]MDO5841703.1 hypothetical protein [Methanobrevibacter ruminantium]
MWVNADEIIEFTGVKPKTFRLEKDDTNGLSVLLEKWIGQSESLICSYCNYDFNKEEDEVPPAVQNVCLRLTANMVALAQARKDTPVVKVNDWSIQTVGSDVFTDDLKDDLAPWVCERKSYKSDKIEFLAITGD